MSDLIKTLKSSETGDNVYPNIKEDNIPSGAVKTAKLDDESVTTDKLGTMAVTTAKIDTGAVTTAKINDSAITTIKLNDGAVTTAKISDGAVTSAKIGSSAVTNAKINDGAVSYDKLATALKNLIDGKASQTDLETLQTAVNGKQDKIDSSHKLDADLVDDSTSTNKFTTASNLSKLSGIESGAEVNTIETISVNGTPITPDANRNVNIATGGGGSTLYLHNINFVIDDSDEQPCYARVIILNDNNTPITAQTLISNLYVGMPIYNADSDGFLNRGKYIPLNVATIITATNEIEVLCWNNTLGAIDGIQLEIQTNDFNETITQIL